MMKRRLLCMFFALMLCLPQFAMPIFATQITQGTNQQTQSKHSVTAKGSIIVTPETVSENTSYTLLRLKTKNGASKLPSTISVVMGDAVLNAQQYFYNNRTGVLQLYTPVTAPITISGFYTITLTTANRYANSAKSESVTIATVPAEAPFSFTLETPPSCILPSSVTIKAGNKMLEMDEASTYLYDSSTGVISFAPGAINEDTTIHVDYPSAVLIVNGQSIFQYGKTSSQLPNGVSYDQTTETLTLDNVTIERAFKNALGHEFGIYTTLSHLKILLKGTNTISFLYPQGNASYGIYTEGCISIANAPNEQNGVLQITTADISGDSNAQTCGIFASVAREPMSIDGITLDIIAGNIESTDGSAKSYGICIDSCKGNYNGLCISNSMITAKGGDCTAEVNAQSTGFYADGYEEDTIHILSSSVSFSGGNVTGTKNAMSYGMDIGSKLEIASDSMLSSVSGNAKSYTDAAVSVGIFSNSSLRIQGAQVTALASENTNPVSEDGFSIGIFASALQISDAQLTAQGFNSALMTYGPIDLGDIDWYQWTTTPNGSYIRSQDKPFKRTSNMMYLHMMPLDSLVPNTQPENLNNANHFSDVHDAGHWAKEAVDFVVAKGLFTGTGTQTFSPDAAATRSMLVTVLWRLEGEPVSTQGISGTFSDVPKHTWYTAAVEWAEANQIVTGYADGTFKPDTYITREQLACILWRYAKYKGQDVSIGEDTNILSFTDAFDISDYAFPALQWACGTGVMNGRGEDLFSPQGTATRAEVAQVLTNFLKSIN